MPKRDDQIGVKNLIRFNKFRDILIILPWAASLLLASPLPSSIGSEHFVAGLPLRFLLIFGLWLFLILVLLFVNHAISAHQEKHKDDL